MGVGGVVDVHDLHVWTLTSETEVATAHWMRELLAERHGITQTTPHHDGSVPRVDVCVVGVDHSLETGGDDALFGCGEVSGEMALNTGEIDGGRLLQSAPAGCGDAGECGPSIVRVGESFDETSVLELGDDPADTGP